MNALILRVAANVVLPCALAFSLFLLWRGHNEPGGGFVGGLIAAAGFTVHGLARGRSALMACLKVSPQRIAGVGLLCAVGSALPSVWAGQPFLTHHWYEPFAGFALGTTLLFDIGVYLAVLGAVLTLLTYYLED